MWQTETRSESSQGCGEWPRHSITDLVLYKAVLGAAKESGQLFMWERQWHNLALFAIAIKKKKKKDLCSFKNCYCCKSWLLEWMNSTE